MIVWFSNKKKFQSYKNEIITIKSDNKFYEFKEPLVKKYD